MKTTVDGAEARFARVIGGGARRRPISASARCAAGSIQLLINSAVPSSTAHPSDRVHGSGPEGLPGRRAGIGAVRRGPVVPPRQRLGGDARSSPVHFAVTCEDATAWLNRPEIGQIGEFSPRLVHFSGFVGSSCSGPVVVLAGYAPSPGPRGGVPGECRVNRARGSWTRVEPSGSGSVPSPHRSRETPHHGGHGGPSPAD